MAHAYDANAAKRLVGDVIERYIPEYVHVQQGLDARHGDLLWS